jgi:hypothetical protein
MNLSKSIKWCLGAPFGYPAGSTFVLLRLIQAMTDEDGFGHRVGESIVWVGCGRVGPLCRTRLELVYSTWLHRQRRVAESRSPLRAAREAFDALGAVRSGERAPRELRGVTARGQLQGALAPASPAWV